MIVYDGLKSDFLHSVENDTIAMEIERNIIRRMGLHVSKSEFQAWNNSLNYMYKVLTDTLIPQNAGIAIEYNIPQTAKRVDFMISGYNKNHAPGMVIIELKQWSELKKVDGSDALVETFTGGAMRRVVHPSYQAWSYAETIYNFNQTVQDNDIILSPCAYLHNFAEETKGKEVIKNVFYKEYIDKAPAFLKNETLLLKNFVEKRIKKASDENILEKIEYGKLRPAKQLADSLCSMLKGNKEFVLLDSQLVVYQTTLYLADLINNNPNKKQVLIVEGGPGTGKSVLAINLLVDLIKKVLSQNMSVKIALLAKFMQLN